MEEYKNTEDKLEQNIILAKYLGYERITPYLYELPILKLNTGLPRHCFVGDDRNSFRFDSDWNWSMEVYKKLRDNNIIELNYYNPSEVLVKGNKQEFFLTLVEVVKYLNGKA